jgi:hypothetical protein
MTHPTIHVFSGPTISRQEVLSALPSATVHPPVACGDLGRIRWRPGDVAAIVDGLFLQAPAVRHKEILTLLQRGVVVCGASSMGALRAAELRQFGMVGIGVVYRLYALGLVDRDDEVAIAHTPIAAGCAPLSVALVAVRVAARHARRAALIDAEHERRLVAAASAIPFAARRWKSVTSAALAAGGEPRQCAAFLDYCTRVQPDVKLEDARRLLRELSSGRLHQRRSRQPPELLWTDFQQSWALKGRGEAVDGAFVSDVEALQCLQLISGDFPVLYRRLCLQLIAAELAGVAFEALSGASNLEVAEQALRAAAARGIGRTAPRRALLHFDMAQHAGELSREELLTLLVRSYRHEPGVVPQARAIGLLGDLAAFADARALVGRCRRYLERLAAQNHQYRRDHVAASAVADCVRRLWPEGYRPGAAQDRGFPSLRAVVRAARPLVPYLALSGEQLPDLRFLQAPHGPWAAGIARPALRP